MEKEIYVLRHGQTEYNQLGIVQGSGVDTVLNEKGHQQAAAFYEKYQHIPFELVITSKLQRTHQTVKGFIEKGYNWIQMPEINEMNWGIYEGKVSNFFDKEIYQNIMSDWKSGIYETTFEGGESAKDLGERMSIFLSELKNRQEKRILVCSHGRAMRCMMTLMDEKPLSEMDDYTHENTGLYRVILKNNRFEIIETNNVSHLSSIE